MDTTFRVNTGSHSCENLAACHRALTEVQPVTTQLQVWGHFREQHDLAAQRGEKTSTACDLAGCHVPCSDSHVSHPSAPEKAWHRLPARRTGTTSSGGLPASCDHLVANSGHEGRPGVSAHGSGRSKPRKPCRSHGRCCTSLLYCSLGTVRNQPSAVDTLNQQTDDLFITRELHTPKARNWPAFAVSTKATQLSQDDRIEVMYAQNAPTPEPVMPLIENPQCCSSKVPTLVVLQVSGCCWL
jgi:hypothetical protein